MTTEEKLGLILKALRRGRLAVSLHDKLVMIQVGFGMSEVNESAPTLDEALTNMLPKLKKAFSDEAHDIRAECDASNSKALGLDAAVAILEAAHV